MFTLRYLTGWLALVIASAGPLPLWMHHALSHSHTSYAHGTYSHVSHSHAGSCEHHHLTSDACLPVAQRANASDNSPESSGRGETSKPAAGFNPTPDTHDCFICYQLSQAASSAMFFAVEISSLPPIVSGNTIEEISIATICGWHTPRGPPTA
jgi:hypothetical protein